MVETVLIAVAILVAVAVGAFIVLHSHNNAAKIVTAANPPPVKVINPPAAPTDPTLTK